MQRSRPTIRMQVGDQLELDGHLARTQPGRDRGARRVENVDPNFPARFDVLPFDAGRFPVRLIDPPGRVATIRRRTLAPRARAPRPPVPADARGGREPGRDHAGRLAVDRPGPPAGARVVAFFGVSRSCSSLAAFLASRSFTTTKETFGPGGDLYAWIDIGFGVLMLGAAVLTFVRRGGDDAATSPDRPNRPARVPRPGRGDDGDQYLGDRRVRAAAPRDLELWARKRPIAPSRSPSPTSSSSRRSACRS